LDEWCAATQRRAISPNFDVKYLNEVAKGLRSFDRALALFEAQEPDSQIVTLEELAFMCREAIANREEARAAIAQCHLPADFHPLWRLGRYETALSFAGTQRGFHILIEQDSKEFSRLFRYLMKLFVIADKRRRICCGQVCHHWWHHFKPRKADRSLETIGHH
jgi:hypothetical protein